MSTNLRTSSSNLKKDYFVNPKRVAFIFISFLIFTVFAFQNLNFNVLASSNFQTNAINPDSDISLTSIQNKNFHSTATLLDFDSKSAGGSANNKNRTNKTTEANGFMVV